jgi:hypothetical protein
MFTQDFLIFLPLIKDPAYLDPGSGSMLIQLLLAALLGAGVLLRTQWNKLKALFGNKPTESEDNEQDDESKK